MDKSELTTMMLEWEKHKRMLEDLEELIKQEIFRMEESFDAGNVHARFSGGRRTFNYQEAGKAAPKEIIEKHTTTVVTTKWNEVCKEAKIEDIPFTMGSPTVSLSIK